MVITRFRGDENHNWSTNRNNHKILNQNRLYIDAFKWNAFVESFAFGIVESFVIDIVDLEVATVDRNNLVCFC